MIQSHIIFAIFTRSLTESIAIEQIQARVLSILKSFAHIDMELYLKNGETGEWELE
jgi:hypothetical protein